MDKIYLITTVHISELWLCIKRKRTVGWFADLWEAEDVVVHNRGDIYECGHYNHCVIEEMVPGIYQPVTREEWFKWGKEGYIIVPKPEELKNASNFSIG